MSDLDRHGRTTVSALCVYLQEAASSHASLLGFGFEGIERDRRTWMLSRLIVDITAPLRWHDTLHLQTWPSGARGSLIATRDFLGRTATGELLLAATSEWVYIDTSTGRIARLPAELARHVPPGTPRVALSEAPVPDTQEWPPTATEDITVRHSDIDLNQHANNTRYTDWMFEPLDDAQRAQYPDRVDILYKLGVRDTDTVRSAVSAEERGILRHRLTRASDGALFAAAISRWAK